jgi:molybdopterin-binding protein
MDEIVLADCLGYVDASAIEGGTVELSARNQLRGTVTGLLLGGVMAEVTVDVNGQELVSVVTRRSAENLGLKEGETITVVIKATEVMLARA